MPDAGHRDYRGGAAGPISGCSSDRICEYALPVSDAHNARLMPPAQHVVELLAAATQRQAAADFYVGGFNDPDRFWYIASRPERTR